VLAEQRDLALLFKDLATLRTNADLFRDVDDLRWRGPSSSFAEYAERIGSSALVDRAATALDVNREDRSLDVVQTPRPRGTDGPASASQSSAP